MADLNAEFCAISVILCLSGLRLAVANLYEPIQPKDFKVRDAKGFRSWRHLLFLSGKAHEYKYTPTQALIKDHFLCKGRTFHHLSRFIEHDLL